MPSIITKCGQSPTWLPNKLRVAMDDDTFEFDQADLDAGEIDAISKVPTDKAKAIYEELSGTLINPAEWGKGGKRPIAVNQGVRNRISKRIHQVTKGWHNNIPIEDIFGAIMAEGLVPIQEDGEQWKGMLVGGAECGTEAARQQYANMHVAGKNAEGKWCLTTLYLHISWCKMQSGKYEIVCYTS